MKLLTSLSTAILIVLTFFSETSSAETKTKIRPEFAKPTIDEGLPNVLLIGDSISIGYTLAARENLKGEANVLRPPTNCGPSTRGIESLEDWLSGMQWDVIHFNFGLHDLKYVDESNRKLGDPKDPANHQLVAIEDYRANLKQIAERLTKTEAVVIWRETTPVPAGSSGRVAGDAKRYNAVAAEVMKQVGEIQTDPFYEFAESIASMQRDANVHYTPEGSQKLGEHVAEVIRQHLPKK